MKGKVFLRILILVVVVIALLGVGAAVYRLGVVRGLAANGTGQVPMFEGRTMGRYVTPGLMVRPFGFGFSPFGFILPLFFFGLLVVGLVALFSRGWRHRGPYGWNGGPHGFRDGEVPPMLVEWHRKMHEADASQPPQPPQEPPVEQG